MDIDQSDSFKKTLSEIILSSNSHGFPNIVRSKNTLLKIVWTSFTLLSISGCAFMIYKSVVQYLEFEVTTKIRIINQFKATFPTVTFCNINYHTSGSDVNFSNISNNDFNHLKRQLKINSFQKFYQSDSLDKLLVDCDFNFIKCNRSEIRLFYHPNYGNCYQFNSGYDNYNNKIDLKKSIGTDKFQGLRLILNVSVIESLKLFSSSYGAVIFVHNQTSNLDTIKEIKLAPKFETDIAIKSNFYESKEKPYSNCDGNTDDPNSYESEIFKFIHSKTNHYTQYTCVVQCLQQIVIKSCKCHGNLYFSYFESKRCVNSSEIACSIKIFEKALKGEINCIKECPLECEGMWFDKTISFNRVTTPKINQRIQIF